MNEVNNQQNKLKEKIKYRFVESLKYRNVSQRKIAEISGVSTRTVSRCANEGILSNKNAKKFASILNLSYEYLLCEIDDPNYKNIEYNNDVAIDNHSTDIQDLSILFNKISFCDKDIIPMLNKIQKSWNFIDKETRDSFIYGLHFVLYLINNNIKNKNFNDVNY